MARISQRRQRLSPRHLGKGMVFVNFIKISHFLKNIPAIPVAPFHPLGPENRPKHQVVRWFPESPQRCRPTTPPHGHEWARMPALRNFKNFSYESASLSCPLCPDQNIRMGGVVV
jgi:hypothetical protein